MAENSSGLAEEAVAALVISAYAPKTNGSSFKRLFADFDNFNQYTLIAVVDLVGSFFNLYPLIERNRERHTHKTLKNLFSMIIWVESDVHC